MRQLQAQEDWKSRSGAFALVFIVVGIISSQLQAPCDPLGTRFGETYETLKANLVSVPPDPKREGMGPSDHHQRASVPPDPGKRGEKLTNHARESVRPARPQGVGTQVSGLIPVGCRSHEGLSLIHI